MHHLCTIYWEMWRRFFTGRMPFLPCVRTVSKHWRELKAQTLNQGKALNVASFFLHPLLDCRKDWNVGLGGQLPLNGWPHDPTTRFWPPSTTMVSPEPLPLCAGSLWCLPEEMATSRLWPVKSRKQCLTLLTPVRWQSWLVACPSCTLQMMMLLCTFSMADLISWPAFTLLSLPLCLECYNCP